MRLYFLAGLAKLKTWTRMLNLRWQLSASSIFLVTAELGREVWLELLRGEVMPLILTGEKSPFCCFWYLLSRLATELEIDITFFAPNLPSFTTSSFAISAIATIASSSFATSFFDSAFIKAYLNLFSNPRLAPGF